MKILRYIKSRFICKHDWENVENSKWYFHQRCTKCGAEKGLGNFKYKS